MIMLLKQHGNVIFSCIHASYSDLNHFLIKKNIFFIFHIFCEKIIQNLITHFCHSKKKSLRNESLVILIAMLAKITIEIEKFKQEKLLFFC